MDAVPEQSSTVEHLRSPLLKRMELLDTSERVIEANIVPLFLLYTECNPKGFIDIDSEDGKKMRGKTGIWEQTSADGESKTSVTPVYSAGNKTVGYFTFDWGEHQKNFLFSTELLRTPPDFQAIEQYIRSQKLSTINASILDEQVSDDPLNTNLRSEFFDIKRLRIKQSWVETLRGAPEKTLENIHAFFSRDELFLTRNYERMVGALPPAQFEFGSPIVTTIKHITDKPLAQGETDLLATRQLLKKDYPEGIEADIIRIIADGDATKATSLYENYMYGVQNGDVFTQNGDYPVDRNVLAADALLGLDNCIFLGVNDAFSNYSTSESFTYEFSGDKLEKAVVISTNLAALQTLLIEDLQSQTTTEFNCAVIDTLTSNTLALRQFVDFYTKYCQAVFDSENSALDYLQKLYPNPFGKSLEQQMSFDSLSPSERQRIMFLWEKHRIYPPFFAEVLVRAKLPLENVISAHRTEPFLYAGRYERRSQYLQSYEGFRAFDHNTGSEVVVKLPTSQENGVPIANGIMVEPLV